MSQVEPELFDDLIMLKECLLGLGTLETGEELARIRALTGEIRRDKDCLSLRGLAVTGRDVMDAGVKPGKAVPSGG